MSDVPTIAGVTEKFGSKFSSEWIYAHILAIYLGSGNKDMGMADSIKSFSEEFVKSVGGFKLTELMLFFHRYKTGEYGRSYSSFDPRQIGIAFFGSFKADIQRERGKYYGKEAQKDYVGNRFEAPKGYSPLSLYNELRDRASRGDKDAEALLHDKSATTEDYIKYLNLRK